MRISNREKTLLCIVGTVAVAVLYYNFVFTSQSEKLKQKRSERAAIEQKYENALAEIKTIEQRKTELAEYKETAEKLSEKYYPEIIQEKLIKEVKALMEKNNLKGDYSWQERNANELESLTPEILSLPESSVKALADVIKSELGGDSTKESNSTSNNKTIASNTNTENNEAQSTETSTATAETDTASVQQTTTSSGEKSGVAPVQMVLAINFKGNYDSLHSFVKDIEEYGRVVVSSALSTSWSSATDLQGTINVEFYSVPKINDDDNEYLDWK